MCSQAREWRLAHLRVLLVAVAGLVIATMTAAPVLAADDDTTPVGDAAESIVVAFGAAEWAGPADAASAPRQPTAIATDGGGGYWVAGTGGGVFSYGTASFHGSAADFDTAGAIMDLEAAPGGDGYWLASAGGGVYAFGGAKFHGSASGLALGGAVLAMTATPTGDGYWLSLVDGGVLSFGAADFHGSAADLDLDGPVVDIESAPDGAGYWLLTAGGTVLAFGSAIDHGDLADLGLDGATAIAAEPDGGYHVALTDGRVVSFATEHHGERLGGPHRTLDLALQPGRGYLTLGGGDEAFVASTPAVDPNHPFLACTRAHESDSAGGYRAVSSSGTYRGAYQFSRATWDTTARHAGRTDLVGVDPAAAAPGDQDFLALHLYGWQGASPWLGRCAGR